MDTRWKNIDKKAKKFFGEYYKLMAEVLLAAMGITLLVITVVYRGYHPTGEALFYGILGNLLLGLGIWLSFNDLLNRKFGNWLPDDDNSYAEWKEHGRVVERWIHIAGAVAFLFAAWYLSYLIGGGNYWSAGWSTNLASGYIMIFSALLQYLLAEAVLQRFQKRQLDYLMEQSQPAQA